MADLLCQWHMIPNEREKLSFLGALWALWHKVPVASMQYASEGRNGLHGATLFKQWGLQLVYASQQLAHVAGGLAGIGKRLGSAIGCTHKAPGLTTGS